MGGWKGRIEELSNNSLGYQTFDVGEHVGNAVQKVRMTCANGKMKKPSQTPLVLSVSGPSQSCAKRVTVSVVIEDDRRSKNGYEAGLFTEGRQRLHASPQQGVF